MGDNLEQLRLFNLMSFRYLLRFLFNFVNL